MALSEEKIRGYMKRLLVARMRILSNHGFFGLLLMHMKYSLDDSAQTAYTDGERIAFSPQFLDELSDSELDFVLMHEIMHVVLQHCLRSGEYNKEQYNIAADIVVNSIIMQENGNDPNSITLARYGESMHETPDGKEGNSYTAEEVYEMLGKKRSMPKSGGKRSGKEKQQDNSRNEKNGSWDNHSKWGKMAGSENRGMLRDIWVKRFADACEAISVRSASSGSGTLPLFAQRMLDELMKPQTDWRSILNEFVQEEINDYSFSPPDRRFQDSPFFLPDFNEKDEAVKDILFMIDTSGSISDKAMTAAYSEVRGALEQFNGKLSGKLGFFDAGIVEPKPFSSMDELSVIRPAGGGGTDFEIIFDYVDQYMQDEPPVSIIILTDGYAPFPAEKSANGIPVLWLINNDSVKPPWGKVARIKV